MSFPSASPPWPRSPRTPPSSNYRSMIHCPRSSRRRHQISPPPFYNPISRPTMVAQWRRCYPLLLRFKPIFNREKKMEGEDERTNERIGIFWAKMNDFLTGKIWFDGRNRDRFLMGERGKETLLGKFNGKEMLIWGKKRRKILNGCGRIKKNHTKHLSQKSLVTDGKQSYITIKKHNLGI